MNNQSDNSNGAQNSNLQPAEKNTQLQTPQPQYAPPVSGFEQNTQITLEKERREREQTDRILKYYLPLGISIALSAFGIIFCTTSLLGMLAGGIGLCIAIVMRKKEQNSLVTFALVLSIISLALCALFTMTCACASVVGSKIAKSAASGAVDSLLSEESGSLADFFSSCV